MLKLSTFSGCKNYTSFAFLVLDPDFDEIPLELLFDLNNKPWDYEKRRECGAIVDNIDGVYTCYICPSCIKKNNYQVNQT